MTTIDWNAVFDEAHTNPGASQDELAEFTATALAPLTRDELAELCDSQTNPVPDSDPLHIVRKPFDPAKWSIPSLAFPDSYLSLLRWSNGAECRSGENWFQFFPANDPGHGVRAMRLGYHLPEYLPGFVPFAFDGCGTFYLFDMRTTAVNDEYPIVMCHSGCLGLDDAVRIAETLISACCEPWKSEDVD